MFTYFVIGIAVQMIIIVERAIRFPEAWVDGYSHWEFWLGFIVCATFNVLGWPLTIAGEIYNVANGQ